MPDDLVLTVRQIAQYPPASSAGPGDPLLIQKGGIGGPYNSIDPAVLLSTGLVTGGFLNLAPGNGIAWNGASLIWSNGLFSFSEHVQAPSINAGAIFVDDFPVATLATVEALAAVPKVDSFNHRTGKVVLQESDILSAGGILQNNPHFTGLVLAPTLWDPRTSNDQVATTAWVHLAICDVLNKAHDAGAIVFSFNGRGGDVVLTADDVTSALTQPGVFALANSPALGDASGRIATTLFVDETATDLQDWVLEQFGNFSTANFAPLASPQFTGVPTAPTAPPGSSTGQIATTAFVQDAIVASTTGVSSFNTRTGAVLLTLTDVENAGGAPLISPIFTGVPQAPTPAGGDNSQKIATTAFVDAAITAAVVPSGVVSFNSRTGTVTLNVNDILTAGGAPQNNANLTGTVTAPTAAPATNNTQVATTAFVTAAIAALGTGVVSFNGRTGAVSFQASDLSAVGGALLNSPAFTGTPTAPTPTPATSNNQQIATTAFVQAAVTAATAGVTTFNGRTGAVILTGADVTLAGGALLASPTFTGVPSAPTPAQTVNDQTLATTAYVRAALAAAPGGVSSWNSRTGNVTLQASDISAVGGALIASPIFTGTPQAPTVAGTDNSNSIATTAWVMGRLAAAGGVASFNGRAGAVTLTTADIIAVSGAAYVQNDTAPATGANNTFWFNSLNGQLYVQYRDPVTSALVWMVANTPVAQPVVYNLAVITSSQTFTTPANSTAATVYKVKMQAAGGGGAGVGAGSGSWAGAGGGGGQYKEFLLSGVAASTAITLTIGAGGAGGPATGGPGVAGGNTTLAFGTTNVVCVGGGFGGPGTPYNAGGAGGRGGATTAGAATLTMINDVGGQDGMGVFGPAATAPVGGMAMMGLPGLGINPAQPNNPSSGYGAGGGGPDALSTAGQVGRPGVVLIERVAG